MAALAVAPLYAAGARAAGQVGAGAPRRVRPWHRGLDALAYVLKALLPVARRSASRMRRPAARIRRAATFGAFVRAAPIENRTGVAWA